jgi:hypothetical protein
VRGFQSTEARHADIEQHDVRLQLRGLLDGFDAVGGLATHFPDGTPGEQRAQALSHQLVIINDEDAYASHDGLTLSRDHSFACVTVYTPLTR